MTEKAKQQISLQFVRKNIPINDFGVYLKFYEKD